MPLMCFCSVLSGLCMHGTQGIACTHVIICRNQEKGGLGGKWKACQKLKLCGLILSVKIVNSLSRIHFNWFNKIHFKLILFFNWFRQILTAVTFWLLIYFQSLNNFFVKEKISCHERSVIYTLDIIKQDENNLFSREKYYMVPLSR